MSALIRDAQETDAEAIASLLGELGYPTTRADARQRLADAFADPSARVLVAELDGRVAGLLAAQVIPYFPDGSRILRVTAIVVSTSQRRRGFQRTSFRFFRPIAR